MTRKSPRKFVLISILSIVILTLLAFSVVPVMAATTTTATSSTSTTTTTATPPTTTTAITAQTSVKTKPNVTGVNPDQASQGATLDVTVNGTNFTGATAITFGRGITVNHFGVTDDTIMTANITIGDHAGAGSRWVEVTNPSGKGALKSGFIVEKNNPVITGVSPNEASQGATLDVTVSGTNFTGATAVSFGGGITVNSFSVTNDTVMTANITIGDHAGARSRWVVVSNPSGKGSLKAGFTVEKNGPVITGVSPDQAKQGATLNVTVNGTNFTGATKVSFGGGITVNSFSVTNDTVMTANITIGDHAGVRSRWVVVSNPSGKGSLKAGFTVTKNEVSVTPSSITTTTTSTAATTP